MGLEAPRLSVRNRPIPAAALIPAPRGGQGLRTVRERLVR